MRIPMYTDDHQTYTSDFTLQYVQKQLQETGDQITKWYEQSLLQGNFKIIPDHNLWIK